MYGHKASAETALTASQVDFLDQLAFCQSSHLSKTLIDDMMEDLQRHQLRTPDSKLRTLLSGEIARRLSTARTNALTA